jgi:Uri superfamily endonuclease
MSFVFFLVKKNYQTAFGCGDNQNKSKKFSSDKQTCLCVCVCVCEDNVCDGHKLTNYPTERSG